MMKKFRLIYLMMILLSSSVLFGQDMSQEEAAFIKSKLMQTETNISTITYEKGNRDVDPITVFPYAEDFESGVFSTKTVAYTASQSDLTLIANAAQNGNFGAQFEGGTLSWGAPPADVDAAFARVNNVSKLKMTIEPTAGATDPFLLEFDLKQKYTFNHQDYEWFRVLIDGVPIADINGNLYHQASTPMADDFTRITYDLSAYQGLASFVLTLENAAKYNPAFVATSGFDGDIAQLDNLSIYYDAPPPAVPLSNWSFVLMGLFSLIFVFIKFKR